MKVWLKSLINKLGRVQLLSWEDRLLALETVFILGFSRLAVILLPFRWIAHFLGEVNKETPTRTTSFDQTVLRLGKIIKLAAPHTPWKSNCLAQAIAGKIMLTRRHIPSTLYIGVTKDKDHSADLSAHAWLRCGDRMVTGDQNRQDFTIVGRFGASKSNNG